MYRGVLLFTCIIGGSTANHWGYGEDDGPENWGTTCLNGFRQSPIDIRAADVDYALLHRMHFIHYDNIGPIHIVNNGHTVKADGFDRWGSRQPYIMGGGLKHRYNLIQFHIHWGQHDSHGSEHMISGLHYPAEIHLVHMRHDVTPAEALRKSDGVAVIGVFVVIGNDGSPMSTFSPLLENILHPGNRTDVESFRTRSLLPSHTDAFYRYRGSLTTPECDEAVIWTVFSEPISITRSQMNDLRRIHSPAGGLLLHNIRPVQPLNGRRILYKPSTFDKKLLCNRSSNSKIVAVLMITVIFSYC